MNEIKAIKEIIDSYYNHRYTTKLCKLGDMTGVSVDGNRVYFIKDFSLLNIDCNPHIFKFNLDDYVLANLTKDYFKLGTKFLVKLESPECCEPVWINDKFRSVFDKYCEFYISKEKTIISPVLVYEYSKLKGIIYPVRKESENARTV